VVPDAQFRIALPDAQPQTAGIDIAMNRISPSTRCYAAFPPLAGTCNEQAISTIRTPDNAG
jgi:hypothetical protein